MDYYNLKSILAAQKAFFPLKAPSASFGIALKREQPFIEPSFEKVAFEVERPAVILISAVGATGKSTLAHVLSSETALPFSKHKAYAIYAPRHLQTHDGKMDLLFINRRGRPYSANKLRANVLHPLLVKLGIPLGGFHSMRHGAASALLADGATPAVVQKQLRHSDPRITLGIYGHVIGNQQRDAVENRSARIEQFAVN